MLFSAVDISPLNIYYTIPDSKNKDGFKVRLCFCKLPCSLNKSIILIFSRIFQLAFQHPLLDFFYSQLTTISELLNHIDNIMSLRGI